MNAGIALIVLTASLLPGIGRAADKIWTKAELLQANEARLIAFQRADVAALDKLLADELVYTHAMAKVQGKAQLIASIKSGEHFYRKIIADDLNTIAIPKGGVVTGRLAVTAGKEPTAITQQSNRFTAVLIEMEGQLKLVAFESTKIPEATP